MVHRAIMAFRPVSPSVKFPELDEELLAFWEREQIFEKTLAAPPGEDTREPFVFYEGPPTANGMPHAGHVLTRVMKDVFLRYRSMCGYYVPRRAGWDTHGLPVEVEVEKALGISGRDAIEAYGVEAFSRQCIDSVFRYIEEWRRMTRRIGFWVDLDGAYVTFHKTYVESVWWALSQLFEQGLLYQGYKVVWWWPQGGTALSGGEVGQGYLPSRRPLRDGALPGGGAGEDVLPRVDDHALDPAQQRGPRGGRQGLDYVTVETGEGDQLERLILAEALVAKVLGDAAHRGGASQGRRPGGPEYELAVLVRRRPRAAARTRWWPPTSCRSRADQAWSTSRPRSAKTTTACAKSWAWASCSC
jgi:isoleucyl-tRNA synthetase